MRLIDADALNLEYEVDMADDWKTAHEIANIVKYAPTVDAEPVKHGKWIKADSQQYFRKHYPLFTCSECGYRKDSQKKWNYCPNCGCRMDKDDR